MRRAMTLFARGLPRARSGSAGRQAAQQFRGAMDFLQTKRKSQFPTG
jgi:hypothetical protein